MKRPFALPLVPFYAAGVWLRAAGLLTGLEPVRGLSWPVISVGNLSVGGTGKTPFTIALAKLLVSEGLEVDVLSRGYGRQGRGVALVDAEGNSEQFGDEPLLIARETGVPVFVGTRRWQAGRQAESVATSAGIHLLDDGFQHRQLARDVDIVIVNSEDLGDCLLPAGNLREGLGALRRATVLAVPAGDDGAMEAVRGLGLKQPAWRFRREMRVPSLTGPVVAFCGIARPEQFFAGLESGGLDVVARHRFEDHWRFDLRDVELLRALVRKSGADALVTTAKDRIRLRALEGELGVQVHTVGLQVELDDEPGVVAWLKARLGL